MIELREKEAGALAAHAKVACIDIDKAVATQFRFAADAVDTILGCGVPARQSQKLIRTFHEGAGKLIEGRGDLVSAILQLRVIQNRSNLAETDWGSDGPWFVAPFFTTGHKVEDGEIENPSETA